jgi:hypothetical protein
MSVTVVGSIAFDSIKTPFGERERALGGSAVHFSLAASYFTDVRVVGPVGDDFGEEEYAVLHRHGIDTADIEHVPGGRTFFWAGEYEWNLNVRRTLDTQLNVFGDFQPKLSDASKSADVLFLANIQPDLQREVREQCRAAKLAALDSMNLWIENTREALVRTMGVPARDCAGPHGSGRRLRRRPAGLPRLAGRRGRPGHSAARTDLRLGCGVLLGRAVRLRARRQPHPRRDRQALRGVPKHDLYRVAEIRDPYSGIGSRRRG